MNLQGPLPVPPALAAGAEIAFICDDHGLIVAASQTIGGLLGLHPEAMCGQPLARLVLREDEKVVRRGLAAARQGGASTFSVALRSHRGPSVKAKIAAWAVAADGRNLTLCLVSPSLDRRSRTEERVRVLADTQKVIATILALALEEIPLDDLLRRTLDLILSIPWLSIERKGAIFLVEDEPRTLVMKVNRGLNAALLSGCARVPFGSCLCGQAALHGTAIHTASLDARHTTRYSGIVPHGHYCVPICSDDTVLGVIATYLAPGHERSAVELEFLSTVANTLAGVLIRRRLDAERVRAERASRRKSEFLALVSHELLTPVTAVMLSCERLERDRAAPLQPQHVQIVARMEGALARLASTIRLLLEHASLESAAPSIHPVDLAVLATHVVEEVRPLAERKGLTVRLALEPPLPVLHSDERLLKIILGNLASNAVKFTETGSLVVRVGYRDGAHRVAVEDTGPGIPPAERTRIFDMFESLEPLANKHVPGLGLGLPLARQLAIALGARLELESASRSGSTFVVTLPELVKENTFSVGHAQDLS